MERASVIIKKVVQHLSSLEGIAALVLAGSQVKTSRFPADAFSDIELYVVAYDQEYENLEKEIQSIQKIFDPSEVVLSYKNQWAGWSILFMDLLRLELPLVKASEDNVFTKSRSEPIEILYAKHGFTLKMGPVKKQKDKKTLEDSIKDFWYMAVYAAQHIARGELWIAREAMRISLQGNIKYFMQKIYCAKSSLPFEKKLEFVLSEEAIQILRETSCSYNKADILRAFWANIKHMSVLSHKLNQSDIFDEYKRKLYTTLQRLLP